MEILQKTRNLNRVYGRSTKKNRTLLGCTENPQTLIGSDKNSILNLQRFYNVWVSCYFDFLCWSCFLLLLRQGGLREMGDYYRRVCSRVTRFWSWSVRMMLKYSVAHDGGDHHEATKHKHPHNTSAALCFLTRDECRRKRQKGKSPKEREREEKEKLRRAQLWRLLYRRDLLFIYLFIY